MLGESEGLAPRLDRALRIAEHARANVAELLETLRLFTLVGGAGDSSLEDVGERFRLVLFLRQRLQRRQRVGRQSVTREHVAIKGERPRAFADRAKLFGEPRHDGTATIRFREFERP